MEHFVLIGDVRIAIDKIDYYYPIGRTQTVVVGINGKEIPFEIPSIEGEFKEVVEKLDKIICTSLCSPNPEL